MAKYAIAIVLIALLFLGAWFPANAKENPIKRLPSSVACSSAEYFNQSVVKAGDIQILSHKKVENGDYIIVYVGRLNYRMVVARYTPSKNRVCIKEMEEGMNFDWKNIPPELRKLTGVRTYPA